MRNGKGGGCSLTYLGPSTKTQGRKVLGGAKRGHSEGEARKRKPRLHGNFKNPPWKKPGGERVGKLGSGFLSRLHRFFAMKKFYRKGEKDYSDGV